MDQSPLISVITPAYNAERFVGDTIRSVIGQTYANWEMIVVDDGSTDSTAAIVKEFARSDIRIKYFHQENQRQSVARNRAMAEASGELVAFLDADDLWLPEKLEICVKEFFSGRQDLLFTDAYIFNEDGDLADISRLPSFSVEPATYRKRDGLVTMLRCNRIPMLTVMARKEALISTGGFREGLAQDYMMWLIMLYEGYALRGIPEKLSLYRDHPDSVTAEDKTASKRVMEILRELNEKYAGEVDYRTEVIDEWFSRFVMVAMKKNDLPYLKEQIRYWDVMTPQIKKLLAIRHIIPFNSFCRKMRRAFEKSDYSAGT